MTTPSLRTDKSKVLVTLSGPCLSIILASLGTSTAAVTLPALSYSFQNQGMNPALVVSAYILATTALIVPMGRAGDLYGKRSVLVTALCLYVLGAFLAFQAPALPVLIASRFVQGAGAAGMMAMPLALVRDLVPSGRIGRWMGAVGTMSAIGTASGPAIGGSVVAAFGWRAVYLLQIPLALVALTLCLVFVRSIGPTTAPKGIDLPGASLLALFLATLTFLVSDTEGGFDVTHAMLAFLSVGALFAFVQVEKRASSPIIPIGLFRSVPLRISLAMNAIVSLVMMGTLVVGPFYLVDGLGLTTAQMGLAMSVGPIMSAVSGIPAGRLTEKLGASFALIAGAPAMALATAMMAAFLTSSDLPGLLCRSCCSRHAISLFLLL